MLGRGQSSSQAAVNVIKPLHPVKKHVTSPPKHVTAPAKTKPAAKKKVAARVVAKPTPKPKPKARPKAPAVIDGMPASLALALQTHPVVVVSLFTPDASVDAIATKEARRGAEVAHAGFVALNVADEKIVAPLSSLLTGASTPADRILDGPAVLVFRRPNTLFVRFNGFMDSDTVAQAAANAGTLAQ
jgi:hypothetical protein